MVRAFHTIAVGLCACLLLGCSSARYAGMPVDDHYPLEATRVGRDDQRAGHSLPLRVQDEVAFFVLDYALVNRLRLIREGHGTRDMDWFVGIRDATAPSGFRAPGAGVLTALNAQGYEVLPCSLASIPNPSATGPSAPGLHRSIENASTGKRACLFYVRFVKVISRNAMIVELVVTTGPLAGSGGQLVIQRKKGKWTVVRELEAWVS